MTAAIPAATAPSVSRRHHRAHSTTMIIGRRAFRQIWIVTIVWAAVFATTVASTAAAYVSAYPTVASRQEAAAVVANDTGLAILLGPIQAIGTVGGYTVYKIFLFLTTIGAIWALLTTTKLLRGEEDAGRWQLVLAGSTRPARATAATLAALLAAVGIVFAGTTVGTMLVGRSPDIAFDPGPSVLYGLSITIVPFVFVGVGAVTSQLARTRRRATSVGMAVFAVAFVLRMIADSGPGTQWLLWTTPFGWSELIRPLTENNLLPLLPALLATVGLLAGAVALAERRDVGDGILRSKDVAQPRSFGLRTPLGLATRLESATLLEWIIGVAATAGFFGIIATVTKASMPESMSGALQKFAAEGTFALRFFAVCFALVATIIALIPASQMSAARDDEATGRLVHVLAQPPSRVRWFVGRLVLTAAAIVIAGLAAGAAAWVGAISQDVDVSSSQMFAAALNCIPIALVSLGIGALALALVPRAAAGVVYGVVIWSGVVYLFGGLVSGLDALAPLSMFHYLAPVPAASADLTTLGLTTGVAVALMAIATALFARRDLRAG